MRTLERLTDSNTLIGNVVLNVLFLATLVLYGFAAGCDALPDTLVSDAAPTAERVLSAPGIVSDDAPMPIPVPAADTHVADAPPADVKHMDDECLGRPELFDCGPRACITPRDGTIPYVVSHVCVSGVCTERHFDCSGVACVGRGGYSRVSGCLMPYGAACQPIDMPAALCQRGFECRDGERACVLQGQ